MDGKGFDELTRRLAQGASRRSVLRGLVGGAGLGLAGVMPGGAAPKPRIEVCHYNGGTGYWGLMSVPEPAAAAHYRHGDPADASVCCTPAYCCGDGSCADGESCVAGKCQVVCSPVDCELTGWGDWSDCSVKCGPGGFRERHRTVVQAESCGGRCEEPLIDKESCIGTETCDHGDECTVGYCVDGACRHEPAEPVDCEFSGWSDWSDCSVECGPGTQERSRFVVNAERCGGTCEGELVESRSCVGAESCDDGNSCTVDSCVDGLCKHTQLQPVDCEVSDWGVWSPCRGCLDVSTRWRAVLRLPSCGGEACPHVQESQSCVHTFCTDVDMCTRSSCDTATGQCKYDSIQCQSDDPCVNGACDPLTGACVHKPVVCSGKGACTTDVCVNGTCVPVPLACDDGNPCTISSCDPLTGKCQHVPKKCLSDGPCVAGRCNPLSGDCESVPIAGCDAGATCVPDGGTGGVTPMPGYLCDDGDPCTVGICDEESGTCTFERLCPTVDDPCGQSICADGLCIYPVNFCDDGDSCTTSTCDAETGACLHTPVDCGEAPSCFSRVCVNGTCMDVPLVCDDGDPCTISSCNKVTGICQHDPVKCTPQDRCKTGECLFGACDYKEVTCAAFPNSVCDPGLGCVCEPNSCGADRCGAGVPDGCGGELTCGDCPSGSECNNAGFCQACEEGSCGCPAGLEPCEAADGTCLRPLGESCNLDSDCCSRSCSFGGLSGGRVCVCAPETTCPDGFCRHPDGCGGTVDCSCGFGEQCDEESGRCEACGAEGCICADGLEPCEAFGGACLRAVGSNCDSDAHCCSRKCGLGGPGIERVCECSPLTTCPGGFCRADDGCGGTVSCQCSFGQVCNETTGRCESAECTPQCPASACGTAEDDGCGGTINCANRCRGANSYCPGGETAICRTNIRCISSADCPETACRTRTCTSGGICQFGSALPATPCGAGTCSSTGVCQCDDWAVICANGFCGWQEGETCTSDVQCCSGSCASDGTKQLCD